MAKSRICVVCGKEFVPAPASTAKTCSRACWRELMRSAAFRRPPAPPKTYTCQICGKTFTSSSVQKPKTCSPECRGKLISRKLKVFAADHHSEHYLTKTCPICGKVFETILNRNRTYCSRKCASKRELPKNSEICVICERRFFAPKSMGFKTCSEHCRSFLRSQNGKTQDLTAMREGFKKNPKTISSPQH